MLADMTIGFFTCLLVISFAARQWPWAFDVILDEQDMHKNYLQELDNIQKEKAQ